MSQYFGVLYLTDTTRTRNYRYPYYLLRLDDGHWDDSMCALLCAGQRVLCEELHANTQIAAPKRQACHTFAGRLYREVWLSRGRAWIRVQQCVQRTAM